MSEQTLVESKAELAVFDEVKSTIKKYKKENEKLVFAYDTPLGEKEARSHIAKLRKVKTKISDIHRQAKADALEVCNRLDAKKRELIGEVEEMIKVHKDPLDAIEAEKQAILEVERKKAEEEETRRLAEIEARERAVREAEEKLAREKAEAELKEREKRIAEEAAEQAKRQAEERLEREKREAEARAQAEINRLKAEAAAKELAERKRKEAEMEKERRRIENKKHREKIESEIIQSLTKLGLTIAEANIILSALQENRITHVSINY